MARVYQGAFNSGEMAPGMWGRVDLERYASGLRVAKNMFPLPEGGIMKRPGLQFIGFVLESLTADGRLIPFKFNNEQTYMLIVSPNSIYIIKNGAIVLNAMDAEGGAGTPVASSDGTGTKVTYTTHGFDAGDVLIWLDGGNEELRERWFKVAASPAPTADVFYLVDYVTGDHVDSSAYTAPAGTVDFGEVYSLGESDGWFDDGDVSGVPYPSVPVAELDYTQANDTLYVAHPSGPTKVITRTSDNVWTIDNFDPAPVISSPTNLGVVVKPASAVKSIWYAVTAIDPVTYEESIASLIEVTNTDDPLTTDPLEIDWDEQTAEEVENFRIYKAVGGIYGLIGTTADPSPGTGGDTLSFVDKGYVPNLSIAPPLNADFFTEAGEYPGAVELFQQRIWFGRSDDKLRDLYASRSGSLSSFATSTVAVDDDPIEQAIVAKAVQEVKHFVPLRDLVVLTSDAEWGFDTGDLGVLTPSAGLVSQSFWGTAGVKPVLVGESAIFVEKAGKSIRDLAYALQNDGFASSDISIFAKHLFRGRSVVAMCFSQTPFRTLFCVMSDGKALSCTYVKDQQIFAWAQHDTNGSMLDCASVTEDGKDNIYVIVERTSTASPTDVYRQIERMEMVDPNYIDQGVWLDNSMTYNGSTTHSSVSSGAAVSGALIRESGGVKRLSLFAASGAADDTLVVFDAAEGSSLSQIDGVVFQVVNPLSFFFDLYRSLNNSTTDRELFNYELIVSDVYSDYSGTLGYLREQVSGMRFAHQLVYRPGIAAVRADDTMYTDVTVDEGGTYEWADTNHKAGIVHAGETYVSEFETLDIDSPQDPITGLPVTISDILLRFTMATRYSIGRRRSSLVSVSVSDMYAREDFNKSLGYFQGVYESETFPGWKRDGRMVVRSEDGFPFQVAAIVPQISAGDIDV